MRSFSRVMTALLRRAAADGHNSANAWRAARNQADERGEELLLATLSSAQREQYRLHRYFEVIGGETGRRYRILHGHQMNIEQLDRKGRRVRLLCFVPKGPVPVGDILLVQELALELFEGDALRVAYQSLALDAVSARRRGFDF
jgi:hypothetical protein